MITDGDPYDQSWANYSPGSDYERITGLRGTGGTGAPGAGHPKGATFNAQVWRRKDAPPSTAKDPAPAPAPAPTPTSPAPRVDAGNPSLADALYVANYRREEVRRYAYERSGAEFIMSVPGPADTSVGTRVLERLGSLAWR